MNDKQTHRHEAPRAPTDGAGFVAREWEREVAARVMRRERVEDVATLRARLGAVVDAEAMARFEKLAPTPRSGGALDAAIPDAIRRRRGVFFTPQTVALRMADLVDEKATGHAIDLSCGDGALLEAVIETRPQLSVVGVEREAVLAVAAAARVVRARGGAEEGDRIIWGDGLERRPELGEAAAVLGNPPYVREKGNRELFRQVRTEHPDLDRYFDARIDLHYLFIHRGLDMLRAGGQLVYLTSEYWLAATGARKLRDDIRKRSVVEVLERLGEGVFDSAPGHHSLILGTRRAADPGDQPAGIRAGEPWTPFASGARLEGPPLEEFLEDHQGFVSGADRATKSVRKKLDREVPHGAPVFIWRRDEIPRNERHLFRPLVRRSDCRANRVFLEPLEREFVLWADGTEDALTACRIEVLLEPFRAALESRREVRKGTMPWYRIWWPRDVRDYARPKLIVPRRSTTAACSLDLSGSHVSSDCTFMTAKDGEDAIPTLLTAMLVLNNESTVRHLRQFGKTKGDVIEFYSEPLQRLPLAVERVDGQVVPRDPVLRSRWKEAVAAVAASDASHVDV
jgi:adenine-specific DNA-methyltransferase